MAKRSITFIKCDRCGTECQLTFQPHVYSVPPWGKLAVRAPEQKVSIGQVAQAVMTGSAPQSSTPNADPIEHFADICPPCTISFLNWFKRQGEFKQ